jgi:two-component system chemotaxis sensor kinase CheA
LAAGKPGKGSERLSATYAGAELAISVSDHGAGLNAERIRAKAIEAGLITSKARIPDQDLYQLIFASGFSTAKEVTALSGRGVGMDVVKRTIDGLRGSIDVSTVPGQGTTVTLRLQDEMFAIAAGGVREILDLVPITDVPNAPPFAAGLINVRGSVVPLTDPRVMFGMDRSPPDADTRIVVMEVAIEGEPTIVGILAHKVHDVTEIEAAAIQEAPRHGHHIRHLGRQNRAIRFRRKASTVKPL